MSDEFHTVTIDRHGQMMLINSVLVTAFGEVPFARVRRYFRDDEWFFVKLAMQMSGSLKGYRYLMELDGGPRECPIRRAWSRVQNIADALAEADWLQDNRVR